VAAIRAVLEENERLWRARESMRHLHDLDHSLADQRQAHIEAALAELDPKKNHDPADAANAAAFALRGEENSDG
jgi:hypothetical protein